MKNRVIIILIAACLAVLQLSGAASAEDRLMLSSLMSKDMASGSLTGAPESVGRPDPLAGYELYEIDYRVPRHLTLQSKHLLHGDLAAGPYTTRHPDLGFTSIVKDLNANRLSGALHIGAAALTSFASHELGHVVTADMYGAEGLKVEFLKSRDGSFFIGSSTYESIPDKSRLPFSMGGEMFSDYTFEYALASYRENPTLYNKSVMLISGVDLLRYTIFSFYIAEPHEHYDPVAVTQQTGLSKETLLGVAIAKTAINAYRVYSGEDRFIPYFDLTDRSATFNVMVKF